MKRKAGVRGEFYPQSCKDISSMIKGWNQIIDTNLVDSAILKATPKAIISPHAGYIYSGFTANIAHRILANSKPKRVLIFGPSHHIFIDGVSASEMESYETPCGDVKIDQIYLEKIKSNFSLIFEPKAHSIEHSTETQVPFIKHYLPDVKIIEFIYGRVDFHKIAKMIVKLLKDKDNAIVISTDLSHFHDLVRANNLDHICLESIVNQDLKLLDNGCEACGKIGIASMIEASKALGLGVKLLDYRTSADVSGDKTSVVGYMSAIVI